MSISFTLVQRSNQPVYLSYSLFLMDLVQPGWCITEQEQHLLQKGKGKGKKRKRTPITFDMPNGEGFVLRENQICLDFRDWLEFV